MSGCVQEARIRAASDAAAREQERRRRQAAEKSGEQRQQEASRAVDEQAFRTLLAEAVKDPGRTWRAARVRPCLMCSHPVCRLDASVC